MTALCAGGGPSSIKPGVQPNIIFDAGLITEGLGLISPWLIPVALLIDAFVWDALSDCTSDPPAMPTAADLSLTNAIGGIFNPGFGTWLTAVNNLLKNWAWSQWCHCNSGAAPTFTFPPPSVGSSSPPRGATTACFTGQWSGNVFQATSGVSTVYPFLPQLYPTPFDSNHSNGFASDPCNKVTAGYYPTIEMYGSAVLPVGTTHSVAMDIGCFDASGAYITTLNFSTPATAGTYSLRGTFSIPTNTVFLSLDFGQTSGGTQATADVTMAWQCNNVSIGQQSGCCDDSSILASLQYIQQVLNQIYNAIPQPLTSYIDGAAHTGLTGNGTLTLVEAKPLAVRVNITTDINAGSDSGNPSYLFDRGYIVPVINSAPVRDFVRLTYNPQLYLLPDLTQQVGYTLPTGEVVTITELIAGP